ncbi:CRISPR-associated protein Cas4 [Candidatus Absconditicoccus praedator]|uniref:CRISPR-associated protein Cas4 n=1 Tax=Candidatus Absconditicoccus praedator TaxID=2735562 RepID=UPI001E44906D|nr:CRISPR-associated protein Cas4 [Candidatus Absconditicoccus praedator]UFX82690.1 CRISPR-associated protein Cas4 [Candidatus Absconditicoccus praedator]
MKFQITASLIAQYMHCPRQGWLFYNNLKSEHTSEKVKIGKHYHELRYDDQDENVEVELDGIKIDKLTKDYVEEFKKANTEFEGVKMQILFYLWKLKQKGVNKKGLIKFKENQDNIQIELTKDNEKELLNTIQDIESILSSEKIPDKLINKQGGPHKKCRGCSYYEFCWI